MVKPKEVRYQVTRKVTVVGAVVNLLLAICKILFGWIAQSQALIADGLHSLSDLLSDFMVYFAASLAKQAPDADHPYGHGRFETAATHGLGLLLVLIAIGIIWDAGKRLFAPDDLLQPRVLAIYVAAISVLSKEILYHYTTSAAQKIGSEMLKANAWHHRSDAISSIVVLIGVGGTMAGLPYLDAIGAVIVGVMIAHIGWKLSWSAFQELVDTGLRKEQVDKIRQTINSIGGVKALHMLRTRKSGGEVSVDVHVLVEPWLSVSEGHMISQMVIDKLQDEFEAVVDVTVHIDPEDDEIAVPCKGLPLRNQAENELNRLWRSIPQAKKRQRLLFHYLEGRIDIDVYFPQSEFKGQMEAKQLCHALQEAVTPVGIFGRVQLFYGCFI